MIVLGTGKSNFDFRIEGIAIHVDDLDKMIGKICGEEILITKTPAPIISLLLKDCAGIISENGGIVSHLAIVSMEMGVPAVLGVQNIWNNVTDGMKLRIVAENGQGVVYEAE